MVEKNSSFRKAIGLRYVLLRIELLTSCRKAEISMGSAGGGPALTRK